MRLQAASETESGFVGNQSVFDFRRTREHKIVRLQFFNPMVEMLLCESDSSSGCSILIKMDRFGIHRVSVWNQHIRKMILAEEFDSSSYKMGTSCNA